MGSRERYREFGVQRFETGANREQLLDFWTNRPSWGGTGKNAVRTKTLCIKVKNGKI